MNKLWLKVAIRGHCWLGCCSRQHSAQAQQSPADAKIWNVGSVQSMSGIGAGWGISGCQVAAEDINAKGGFTDGGQRYEFKTLCKDDKLNTADGVTTGLHAQDQAVFFGFFSSTANLAGLTYQ